MPELPFEDTFLEKYGPSVGTLVKTVKWLGIITVAAFLVSRL